MKEYASTRKEGISRSCTADDDFSQREPWISTYLGLPMILLIIRTATRGPQASLWYGPSTTPLTLFSKTNVIRDLHGSPLKKPTFFEEM
jgi:hypothetical protein